MTFGEYLFPPGILLRTSNEIIINYLKCQITPVESPEAADTIAVLAKTFCDIFPINAQNVEAGLPGILIGR